jgi:hypothetical protein
MSDPWIAVTDALPRQVGRYLIWTPHGWPDFAYWHPGICYYCEGRWADGPGEASYSYQYGVTHWQELPDGPRNS